MKPRLILAVIAGGMAGVFTNTILNSGLVAPPSPGSIFALAAMAPRGGLLPVLAGVVIATIVSFVVASILLKTSQQTDEDDLEKASDQMKELKGKGTHQSPIIKTQVNKIVFSCDAGMGSSAMGAATLRKKCKEAGLEVEVVNTAINDIPEDADIIITHRTLTERAKAKAPHAEHVSIDNFLNNPKYEELIQRLS